MSTSVSIPKLTVEAAATRFNCSPKAIRRRVANGSVPATKERVAGSDGRFVYKLFVDAEALEAEFAPKLAGPAAHEAHVRAIEAAAPALTEDQKARIALALRGDAA
ncbi:hypothetical protein [Nocardia thailandica]|uniref:hypothetical protein n=1 Tax=Nocardia thailandica TaxID=257275 RepID=UPI0005B966D5|nr:hypothetical protein [Nocardia thailandica]